MAGITAERAVDVRLQSLPPSLDASWVNPRAGERQPVVAVVNAESVQFATPAADDWLLWLKTTQNK